MREKESDEVGRKKVVMGKGETEDKEEEERRWAWKEVMKTRKREDTKKKKGGRNVKLRGDEL